MGIWATHKGELVAAVLGAAVAGVLSMALGLYSLTKSFEYAQNKEQLASLRKDIEFLTRVRSEIETNTQFMVSEDYRIRVKLGKRMSFADFQDKDKKGEQMSAQEKEMFSAMMGGGIAPLLELHVPRELLVAESWGNSYPEGGDIEFELLNEINDYYRRVKRLNVMIEHAQRLSPGSALQYGFSQQLLRDAEYHNAQVVEFGKLNTVLLRQKVEKAIQRLSEARRKISERVAF